MKIKLTEDFSTMIEVSRQLNKISEVLRENNFQPEIIHLEEYLRCKKGTEAHGIHVSNSK